MLDPYIAQYGRRLYGLCLSLCGTPHAAEDLYQDTWLKALVHFAQYDPARPFEPWLTGICVNLYRNRLRRLARSPVFSFASGEEQERVLQSVPEPEPPDYTPLYAAVQRLPEKLRVTVILYYFQDMDIARAAAVLRVPQGTVKSRLNKARKQLKEVLTDAADL